MSDYAEAAVMVLATALFVVGPGAMLYALPRILEASDAVVHGERKGRPISERYRLMILIHIVGFEMLCLFMIGAAGALCFLSMASFVEQEALQMLCTVLGALAALSLVFLTPFGVVWIAFLRSEWRASLEGPASADRP